MKKRLTLELHDPELFRLLKEEADRKKKRVEEVVVRILRNFLGREKAFAEWDNPKDAEYDRL